MMTTEGSLETQGLTLDLYGYISTDPLWSQIRYMHGAREILCMHSQFRASGVPEASI